MQTNQDDTKFADPVIHERILVVNIFRTIPIFACFKGNRISNLYLEVEDLLV